jgi:hypothetical protein
LSYFIFPPKHERTRTIIHVTPIYGENIYGMEEKVTLLRVERKNKRIKRKE